MMMSSQMWNPYQTLTTANGANKTNLYTSGSNSPSSSGSSSASASPSEKLNGNGLPHQTPLSISSLLPTPSYDEDDEQSQQAQSTTQSNEESQSRLEDQYYLSGQSNGKVQLSSSSSGNGTNSDTTTGSSDLSSISATSTPSYRSPPTNFLTHAPNYPGHQNLNLYPAQAYNLSTQHYSHHPHANYQYLGGFDINNPYYSSPNFNSHESIKLTPLIKTESNTADYNAGNNNSNRYSTGSNSSSSIKQELDETKVTPPPSSIGNSPTSLIAPPPHTIGLPPLNGAHYNLAAQANPTHAYPHYAHAAAAAAYYNNMNLNSSTPSSYPHYNHFNHNQHYLSLNNSYTGTNHPQQPFVANNNNNLMPTQREDESPKSGPAPSQQPAPSANKLPEPAVHCSPSTPEPIYNNLKTNNNPNIKVKLQDLNLWKQFNQIGTEMIITKCGRRMFPSLRVTVSGLESTSKYAMMVDIIPLDDNRYKYHNCEWVVSGKAEAHFSGRGYLHPDTPLTGSQWMKQVISFHKLKLTNNPFDRAGHIILNSMHKYVPRLHIIEEGKSISTFLFNEAVFTAVTAYQNESITKLKIEYNPFAKGFRDGQSRKDYRGKRCSDDENESLDMDTRHFQNVQMLASNQQANKMARTNSNPLSVKDMNKFNQAPVMAQQQQHHPQQHSTFMNQQNVHSHPPQQPYHHHQQQQQLHHHQQLQQQLTHNPQMTSSSHVDINYSMNKFINNTSNTSSEQNNQNADSILYDY